MSASATRLAVVTSHPIQYQAPWFRALAEHVDLHVFFCHRQDGAGQAAAGFGQPFEWDVPLTDGYGHSWLRNVADHPNVDSFSGCDTPEIADRLRDGGFDACLVNGWYLKSYLQAVRACRHLGVPVMMRGDSRLGMPASRVWTVAKYLPYRWFLSRIDAHLFVGAANRRYLMHYGVPEARLFPVLHFVDNERFARTAREAREDGSSARLRGAWGAKPGTTVCLFAGKLIEKKRPADFVDAVASAARQGADVLGVVVGAGQLEPELRQRAVASRAPIVFAGFQNQSAIPRFYSAADVIVLPSDRRETWGLVVNEAMACGVPSVVSDVVGCRDDLVVEGLTGFSYPLGDVASLSRALIDLARRAPDDAARMRTAVQTTVEGYSCEAAVRGTLTALEAIRRRPAVQMAS